MEKQTIITRTHSWMQDSLNEPPYIDYKDYRYSVLLQNTFMVGETILAVWTLGVSQGLTPEAGARHFEDTVLRHRNQLDNLEAANYWQELAYAERQEFSANYRGFSL